MKEDVSLALFQFLEYFPFSTVLSFFAMLMVIVFFVTSADSGAMVVDTLASGGDTHTPVWQRIFWAGLMGVVAITLLLAGIIRPADRNYRQRPAVCGCAAVLDLRTDQSPAD